MYLTRFTRTDGKVEDYYYNTVEEAADHLHLFVDDNSGLYANIAVLHCESTTVLGILPFEDGVPGDLIAVGSQVRLRAKYSHPEERKYIFKVTNLNEVTGHVNIQCLNSLSSIPRFETAGIEMLQLIKS